ncbi:MAG: hypothetical protein KAV82_07500, partial [Phycisphaerae bacterium]|nr:hypothetical protein [Phycisphaerae bacterium]
GGMVHACVAMQKADDVMERPNVPGLPRISSRNPCPRKRGHGTRHNMRNFGFLPVLGVESSVGAA